METVRLRKSYLRAIALGIVYSFLFALLLFLALPDTLVTHFSAAGVPDAYGSKLQLFIVPFVSFVPLAFYWFFSVIQKGAAKRAPQKEDIVRKTQLIYDCSMAVIVATFVSISLVITYDMAAFSLGHGSILVAALLLVLSALFFSVVLVFHCGPFLEALVSAFVMVLVYMALLFPDYKHWLIPVLVLFILYSLTTLVNMFHRGKLAK